MSVNNANNASFYADFGSLAALKRDARADGQKALRAAAQQFESLFTDMMLKSMRAASVGDSLTGSDEVEMYQGMFDQQLALQLSRGKGLGLADMLVQQLTRSGLVPATADGNDNGGAAGSTPTGTGAMSGTPTSDKAAAGARLSAPGSLSSQPADAARPIAAASWPPATPEEFVQTMLPHAQAAAATLGVDPATLVAHAALETGWGKHVPGNPDGSSSFNLFGIKATPAWQGQSTSATTVEFAQGAAGKRVERFKSYDSPAECFGDYTSLLSGAARYAGVRNSGDDVARFAQSLQQGGYATDPQYASKLRVVAGAVRAMRGDAVQVATSQVVTNPADI